MIICEGNTDYFAVKYFLGNALAEGKEISAHFVRNTNLTGGWGHVLGWLNRRNPKYRMQNFFKSGIFSGRLGIPPIDALVIQLDSDVLGNPEFTNYVRKNYGNGLFL